MFCEARYCLAVGAEGVAPSSSTISPNSERFEDALLVMPFRLLLEVETATLLLLDESEGVCCEAVGVAGGPMFLLEILGILVGV